MGQTRASSSKKACLEDIGAQLEVRRHPGARRLTLRVSRTRRAVIVTLPVQCDLDEAGSFLNRHIDWVRERLDSLPDRVPFDSGALLPIRGEPHRIVFSGDELDGRRRSRLITLARPAEQLPELRVPGDSTLAPKRIKAWLNEQARQDLDASVVRYARAAGGLKFKRIAVRDQTSRWGSCSTTGVVSFSWRLILAPPFVLDYVAAHEVAHLAEMNHGPKFWALVQRICPNYQEAKLWLQVRGPDLHRYGSGI